MIDPAGPLAEESLSDEELTALALAADPGTPLADDAVPIGLHLARYGNALPLWYMPPIARSGGGRWKVPVVLTIVGAFVLIDLLGLCNTYGILSLA